MSPRHVITVVCVVIALVAGLLWHKDRQSATSAPRTSSPSEAPATTSAATAPDAAVVDDAGGGAAQEVAISSVTLDPQPTAADDAPPAQAWSTEIASSKLKKRLKKLAAALVGDDAAGSAATGHFAAQVSMPTEGEPQRQQVGAFTVTSTRWSTPANQTAQQAAAFVAKLLGGSTEADIELKIDRIERDGQRWRTDVLALVTDGTSQRHGRWVVQWAPRDPPQIAQISVGRDVIVERASPLFSDATGAVLRRLSAQAWRVTQVDADAWLQGMAVPPAADPVGHQGLAVGDVNGDGLDDIYLCATAGAPNRLLVQQPDGSVVDEALQRGVALLDLSRSALLIDVDNDGDQDLVVSTRAGDTLGSTSVLLARNLGDRFAAPQAIVTGGDIMSMTAADFDSDGDLDLYLCAYNGGTRDRSGFGLPVPYHDARNGGRNVLLANAGDGSFKDVTDRVGLGANNDRWSLAAAWEDYDNDGDQDLYVANDFGRNTLYRNEKGRFVEVAAAAGVEDLSAGMSVSWADIDRDGDMDLYVSNMYSAAGRRIAPRGQFLPGVDASTRSSFVRHARGNTLLRNRGDGTFEDISAPAGVLVGRWAWGALLADLNSDGHDDAVVVNGMFTRSDSGDL